MGKSTRSPARALVVLWLLVSVATVQLTLPNWRDDVTLWTWGARRAPLSPTPPINLGLAYANMGNTERAIAESERALQLDPEQGNAWNNMGLALFYQRDHESAQRAFEAAVRLEPENAVYWSNLAAALRELERVLSD